MSSVVCRYDTHKQNYSFLNSAFFKTKVHTSIHQMGIELFTRTTPAITINRFQIKNYVATYDHSDISPHPFQQQCTLILVHLILTMIVKP